jgi:hypothetical protein
MGPIRLISEEGTRLEHSAGDIASTLRASEVTIESGEDLHVEVTGLKPVFKALGPLYKDRMKAIVEALKDPKGAPELARSLEGHGSVEFDPGDGNGPVRITSDMAEVERTWRFKGKAVDHISVTNIVVVLES